MSRKVIPVVAKINDTALDTEVAGGRAFDNLSSFMTSVGEGGIVELHRMSPDKDHNGICIKGFLDNLPVGTLIKSIQERWGGGRYRLIARGVDGRFVSWCDVEVAGVPKPEVPPLMAAQLAELNPKHPSAASSAGAGGASASVPAVSGGGEGLPPLGADMGEFVKWCFQLKALEVMRDTSGNQLMRLLQTLLPVVVDKKQPGSLSEQVEPVLALLDTAERRALERLPVEGGDDMTGLLVKMLLPLLAQPKAPALTRAPAGRALASSVVNDPAVQPMNTNEDGSKVDTLAVLSAAVEQVVTSFTLTPSLPPERVIKVLKMTLPLPRPALADLRTKRQEIADFALIQAASVLDTPERANAFADYFAKVFEGFTDIGE